MPIPSTPMQVEVFDCAAFRLPPAEASVMDPQQRLLLECTFDLHLALQSDQMSHQSDQMSHQIDQKYSELRMIGTFVGIYPPDRTAAHGLEGTGAYAVTGGASSVAAGRLAYTFGHTGPAVSVDTACSSSLVCAQLIGPSWEYTHASCV